MENQWEDHESYSKVNQKAQIWNRNNSDYLFRTTTLYIRDPSIEFSEVY
jgi:hypothetical protein